MAYAMVAIIVMAGVGAWYVTRPDTPHFEAEALAINDKGALYRVTAAVGGEGVPLRWDDVSWNLPTDALLDSDGIISPQEPFFVYAADAGRLHVITAATSGHLLWTGAFTALQEDDPTWYDETVPPGFQRQIEQLIGNGTRFSHRP